MVKLTHPFYPTNLLDGNVLCLAHEPVARLVNEAVGGGELLGPAEATAIQLKRKNKHMQRKVNDVSSITSFFIESLN